MYIMLDKVIEKEHIVTYSFCMKIWEYDATENSSNKRAILNKKIGIGTFNKNTDDFIVSWNKTDKYYLDKSYELSYIKWYIMKHKHLPMFPDIIDIATG